MVELFRIFISSNIKSKLFSIARSPPTFPKLISYPSPHFGPFYAKINPIHSVWGHCSLCLKCSSRSSCGSQLHSFLQLNVTFTERPFSSHLICNSIHSLRPLSLSFCFIFLHSTSPHLELYHLYPFVFSVECKLHKYRKCVWFAVCIHSAQSKVRVQ